jgi:four helix bundle protein
VVSEKVLFNKVVDFMGNSMYKLDDFDLYKTAREFRKKIYKVIKKLPADEKYVLGFQMRKAAISITNNIAEGHGRWHYQENIQFCRIARGSVEEIIDDFNVCMDENYCTEFNFSQLKEEAYELILRINRYISYLKRNQQGDA